jgi:phosphatidylinositol glycan class N
VSLGYLGWIVFSLIFIASLSIQKDYQLFPRNTSLQIFIGIFVAGSILLYQKESPASYYAYLVFPVLFWSRVIQDIHIVKNTIFKLTQNENRNTIYYTVLYLLSLEILVYSSLTRF